MDDSKFGPAFERFRNNVIGEALPLPPTYRFEHGQHTDMDLVCTDGLQETLMAKVIFSPPTGSMDAQQLLLLHIADRLTFPRADRRKNLKDKKDDQKLKPKSQFAIGEEDMGDGFYCYNISQSLSKQPWPFATFICDAREHEQFKGAIHGAVRDLELSLDNIKARRSFLLPRPWPNPRWLKGMQP